AHKMKASINFIFIFFIVALFSLSGCRGDPVSNYHYYDDYYDYDPYYGDLIVENHTKYRIDVCVDGYCIGSIDAYDYEIYSLLPNRYCIWFEQPYTGMWTSEKTVRIRENRTTTQNVYQSSFYYW
ncbi:MAG: hypothetical protein KJ613_01670, partial [Nanoarchaeota archaeon]|nr:hypothetical protein [Nanoarchaeota archaeon]